MTKYNLVVGKHYAQFRNGKQAILVYNEFDKPAFLGLNGKYISLDNLNYDLTHVRASKFDVVKIGVMGTHRNTPMFEFVNWAWERTEVQELTVAEISAKLGYEVKVVR